MKHLLTQKAIKAVGNAVSALFERARKRLLNKNTEGKTIRIGVSNIPDSPVHREDLSLKGVFDASAKSEGMAPNEDLYASVSTNVSDYLDAYEQLTRARAVHAVQSYVHDRESGKETKGIKSLNDVLGGVFSKASDEVETVVDTELNKAKNISALDAISKVSSSIGIEDPVVFFAGPVDGHTCENCIKMYFLDDKITPRVWKASELKAGYWKKGDATPCVGALHPNCRHALSSVLLGYGFKAGKLEFIEPGYNVWAEQRK